MDDEKERKNKKPTASDKERLVGINYTMGEIYDDVDAISEDLVDGEYKGVLKTIKALKKKLTDLENTLR